MLSVRSFMQDQVQVLIKSGTTSFWYFNWSGLGILANRLQYYCSSLPDLQIVDVYPDGHWVGTHLDYLFSPEDLQVLRRQIFTFIQAPDVFVWASSSRGSFSIASAYALLRVPQPRHYPLKLLWNSFFPPKISMFLWRLFNLFLPFPEVLCRLGFSFATKCPACDSVDSMEHWFLHCSFARIIWMQVFSWFQIGFRIPTSLWFFFTDWWAIHCKPSSINFFLPGLVCWVLWKARCGFLYGSQDLHAGFILREIWSLASAVSFTLPSPRVVRPIAVAWCPPPFQHIKLNVDGSALGNPGLAGAGVVLRDSLGRVIAALSVPLGTCSNVEAEILAAAHGLLLASSLHLTQIMLETDSKLLVDWLHLKLPWPWIHFHKLHSLLQSVGSFPVAHIYREANSVADSLAKLASSSQSHCFFGPSDLPLQIRGLVALDQRQCPYVRYKL